MSRSAGRTSLHFANARKDALTMARLTFSQLAEVRAKVNTIRDNLEKGRRALSYTGSEATLLQTKLKFEELDTIPNDPFQYTDVRAEYFWRGEHITLKTFPAPPAEGGSTVDDRDGFEKWVAPVLAHEVCHMLQHRADSKMFEPGGCGNKAKEWKEAYLASNTWADYHAYVSCLVELEAHATQMAVEVSLTNHMPLDQAAFLKAAKNSDLAKLIWSRAPTDTDQHKTISGEAEALVARLASEGWIAYHLLQPIRVLPTP